ncbi:MAG: GNAT family N-acetyltransferase [Acidimicrobiia bacterium]
MWEVRTIESSEADLFRRRVSRGFGRGGDADVASRERFDAIVDLDRTLAAFDGGDIVGTCSAFPLGVTVPGGATAPMAGTTVITVQPTHRRMGVMRALMSSHLADIADRGEPLAGLWASESSIYGRFGYAPATYRHKAVIDGSAIEVPSAPSGQVVRFLEGDETEPVVRGIYEAVRPIRAGMLTRSDAWWKHRVLADPEESRDGRSPHRHVVVEEDGHALGYATFRQRDKWEDFRSFGEIHVSEIVTASARARHALWRFLMNIDLFPTVEWWNMPVDESLPDIAPDFRSIRRTLADSLWVRVMSVEAALEQRRYEDAGEVVFEVADETWPDNTGVYRLTVEEGRASCERSISPPSLRFLVDVLGHLYLGGGNALSMADAGRIEGDEEAVMTLHRLFRAARSPWCPEVF